tara:strand:- start:262 stop:462 length:201 start_codon:yes stop_codon:yes gene_type:complete
MSPETCPPKRVSDELRRSSAVAGPVVARSRRASLDIERESLESMVVGVEESFKDTPLPGKKKSVEY